jgi:hypothetical protein
MSKHHRACLCPSLHRPQLHGCVSCTPCLAAVSTCSAGHHVRCDRLADCVCGLSVCLSVRNMLQRGRLAAARARGDPATYTTELILRHLQPRLAHSPVSNQTQCSALSIDRLVEQKLVPLSHVFQKGRAPKTSFRSCHQTDLAWQLTGSYGNQRRMTSRPFTPGHCKDLGLARRGSLDCRYEGLSALSQQD